MTFLFTRVKVGDVWTLEKKDRWRLYRSWVHTVNKGYKRTVDQHRLEFEESARELKKIKDKEDSIVLGRASVVGMTTTGLH